VRQTLTARDFLTADENAFDFQLAIEQQYVGRLSWLETARAIGDARALGWGETGHANDIR
jgi:hypothetical protein